MSASHSLRFLLLATCLPGAVARAQNAPPTIAKGTAPQGDVHGMPNNRNSLAHVADGAIAAVIYRQTSDTAGGHLTLAITRDVGTTWDLTNVLPQNTGHRIHDRNSGVVCGGRRADLAHVAWADRSKGGVYHSAYYQAFNTTANRWEGPVVTLGAADPTNQQEAFTRDIAVTPRATVVVAIGNGATGGLGMGPYECGLLVRKRGAAAFSALQPMRNGGLPWAREATICVIDEVVHCAFKNQKGAGGIAYRSFDTERMQWLQPAPVMVGPNDNGTLGVDGINAGNRALITQDTHGGLYILYPTGSNGGLRNNNKLRMAYAKPGTGGRNADWTDLEILAHDASIGANPRGVPNPDPAYPQLLGGDTDYYNYGVAPGPQGGVFVVYSKPWEDFSSKYMQVWLDGVNQPLPTKEIAFWPTNEPYMFERLSGMRNSSSIGHAAWIAYGKNDKPAGSWPNGHIRLWATTYSIGRTLSYGTGCRGSLAQVPRMGSDQIPVVGRPYEFVFDRFPIAASFLLAVGSRHRLLDLAVIGAPGCELNVDFAFVVPFTADITGFLRVARQLPNQPTLIGVPFFCQAFVFNSLANPVGVITSNATRTTFYF